MAITAKLAEELDAKLQADLTKDARLGKPKRYLAGEHDDAYMPKGAKAEFKHLAKRAVTNWLPLVSDTFARDLFVEGYRTPKSTDDEKAWEHWQRNGLDARQSIAIRGALDYGASYVLVLPGDNGPVIKPLSPLRSMAWYADEDDLWPTQAIRHIGRTPDGKGRLLEVYEDNQVVTYEVDEGGKYVERSTATHPLDYVPWVRFRDRLDGQARGLITPLIPLQDRVNEISFATLIAIQYASFRQRWATGLAIPVNDDPEDEDFGKPLETFESAINRLWISDSSEAKFGDFAQTELSGHHTAYTTAVKTLAAIGQISPDVMMGQMVNVSGEALLNMQHTTRRKRTELEVIFGESWEQVFRLAAAMNGDPVPAPDAQVRWRDADGTNMAATVDALGKMVQMLGVPQEALWEKVPGITEQDLLRWRELATVDPLDALTEELRRQTSPVPEAPAAVAPVAATPAEDPAAVKAKADAFGALVRAGVAGPSAAAQVGLEGLDLTGAVPVSLRMPTSEASVLEDA